VDTRSGADTIARMSGAVSQPISASQYAERKPFQPTATATWSAFTAHIVDIPAGFRETLCFADTVLNLRLSGTCRLRQDADGRSRAGRSGPGSLHVIPAHFLAKWEASAVTKGSSSIVMFVPEAFLARVAEEGGLDPSTIEIIPQFLIHDPVVESVMTRLAVEARAGSPSGQLYAESACEFLAHHLLQTSSSRSRSRTPSAGGLPRPRLRAVLEYIEEGLGEPITLRQLAELAGVAPRHLERAFRQSVGSPPHAYVVQRRVAAARLLLLSEPRLPVESVAARVGFSSSSHLATAFRRHMGCSPAAFRRTHAS
jgi:AraC family transcriptional regulator